MSLRLQRVRELLLREIGEIIRREIPVGDSGLINVHDVHVAPDLHTATVFIGIVGSEQQKKHGYNQLRKQAKRIQMLVAHNVVLKYTPHLRFIMDGSVERGNRVLDILEELDKSLPPS